MLNLLAKADGDGEGEEEVSQLSDEGSSSHVEKQIQALQEVLHQLSPRTAAAAAQAGSSVSSSGHAIPSLRGKRRQHSRHVRGSDSDNADRDSDDALASGANSCSSSRPSSGSRRRRRQPSKAADAGVVKRYRGYSSEEYVSSDSSSSIFSDDSLTLSGERHETSASRISDVVRSDQQLTARLGEGGAMSDAGAGQDNAGNDMEEHSLKSVPALVSYFESQASGSEDRVNGRERSADGGQNRAQRESSVTSLLSDEGSSSASEATQTAGGSVVMSKAPVSVHSAGDPDFVVSSGAVQSVSGSQNIHEVSSVGAGSRQSWKLSVTPTQMWYSSAAQQSEDSAKEEGNRDAVRARRKTKSKLENTTDNPEKRQRQDKLTTLHSKYGLMEEAVDLSEQELEEEEMEEEQEMEEEVQEAATDVSGQGPAYHQTEPPLQDSHRQEASTAKRDTKGKLQLEVAVSQGETNVLYNVETIEYKTCSLKNGEESASEKSAFKNIPETININVTETTTLQREDHFETVTKERVLFSQSGEGERRGEDVVLTERTFTRGHTIDVLQDREGNNVNRESSVERALTDEETSSNLKVKDAESFLATELSAAAEVSVRSPLDDGRGTTPPTVSQNVKAESSSSRHTPSTQSPALSAGDSSDQTVDTELPAGLGRAELLASPSAVSQDKDGMDSSATATTAAGHTDPGFVSTTELPGRVVMRREEIKNTFHRGEPGSVVGQLHQRIAMRQGLPQQTTTEHVPHLPTAQQGGSADLLEVPPGDQMRSSLQVEVHPPDTLPPMKPTAAGGASSHPETSQSFGSNRPETSQSFQLGVSPGCAQSAWSDQQSSSAPFQRGVTSCADRPDCTEQAVDIPVLHQHGVSDTPVSSKDSTVSESTSLSQGTGEQYVNERETSEEKDHGVSFKGSEPEQTRNGRDGNGGRTTTSKLPGGFPEDGKTRTASSEASRLQVNNSSEYCENTEQGDSASQTKAETNDNKSLNRKPDPDTDGPHSSDDAVRFFPADVWVSSPGVDSLQSDFPSASTPVTDGKDMVVKKPDDGAQSPKAAPHKASPTGDRSAPSCPLASPSLDTNLAASSDNQSGNVAEHSPRSNGEGQRRQSRPSVEEIPLERVEVLPHTPVGHGPQPAKMYPNCRDGFLLSTSSSCSEDPYSWVDVFREETGMTWDSGSSPRRGRLASEQDAEAFLVQLKRRSSRQSDSDEEEFFEEIVVTSHEFEPATFLTHFFECVPDQRDSVISPEDSAANAGQRTQLASRTTAGYEHDPASTLASGEYHSAPLPGNSVTSQQDVCSTPLSQTPASPEPAPERALPLLLDDSTCTSAEETLHSPDTTLHSSSGSSAYRTPQQSPRQDADGGTSYTGTLALAGDPGEVFSPQAEKPAAGALTAVVSVVGRELAGRAAGSEVETVRKILKREVERQIARLERRVRSLSDSAISSDFTDPESTSVSPRSSRVPVSDVSMDQVAAEATMYWPPPFLQSAQDVFFSNAGVSDDPKSRVYARVKPGEKQHEKSLEDSGNVHDDEWQDGCSGQAGEPGARGGISPERPAAMADGQAQSMSPQDQHGAARAPTISTGAPRSPSTPSSGRPGKHVDFLAHLLTSSLKGMASTQATPEREALSHIDHPSTTASIPPSWYQQPPSSASSQLTGRFSEQVVGVVDSVLSVQQSWPSAAFEPGPHRRRRPRGLAGRKAKSLSSLAELTAAREYSSLQENLLQQARKIVQAARSESSSETRTGGRVTVDEATPAKGDLDEGEPQTIPLQFPAHHWRGRTRAEAGGDSLGVGTSTIKQSAELSSISQQAVRHIIGAAGLKCGGTVMQPAQSEETGGLVQPAQSEETGGLVQPAQSEETGGLVQPAQSEETGGLVQPAQSEETGGLTQPAQQGASSDTRPVGAASGSSTPTSPPSSRAGHREADDGEEEDGGPSPDADSEGETSEEYLLTSGELEVAAINARAAVRNFRPRTDADPSRSLSPGEEILADILASQYGVASDEDKDGSRKRVDQLRIRGASPPRRPTCRREAGLSQEELSLSEQARHHLQSVDWDLQDGDSAEGLQLSSPFRRLDGQHWSGGQLRMLHCKALSTSSLDTGHWEVGEDEQDLLVCQMERPASLACLEGLVLEDSQEDGNSSADSICFVFMGQRTPDTEGHLQGVGGSTTEGDGSGLLVLHSRSTEDLAFDGEHHELPFSEHSASMDNIYSTVTTSTRSTAQLHRSRSTSLLDVGTNAVNDASVNEAIFPPHVRSGSHTSSEGVGLEPRESCQEEEEEEEEECEEVSTITNPAFIHRPSLVEPSAEQHLYMTSPTQLFTSGPADMDTVSDLLSGPPGGVYQLRGDQSVPASCGAVVEVESGQPYFRYRAPGVQPLLSDSGAQTDKDSTDRSCSVTSGQETHHLAANGYPAGQSAGSGSGRSLHQSTSSTTGYTAETSEQLERLCLSPNKERWLELSHLMLETTAILQNLQQTFPSPRLSSDSQSSLATFRQPVLTSHDALESSATQTEYFDQSASGPAHLSVGGRPRGEVECQVETGTQTPTEPFSPQVLLSRYASLGRPLESPTIVIKVKDALTQTGFSLGDLSTAEVQTEAELQGQPRSGSTDCTLRPSTRDASSGMHGITSLTRYTSQTDNSPFHSSSFRDVRGASSSVGSLRLPDPITDPTGDAAGPATIQKETKDASCSYDMLYTSDTTSQTDFLPETLSSSPPSHISRPESSTAVGHHLPEAGTKEARAEMKSTVPTKSDTQRRQVSVCTQMSVDQHRRYIAVTDAEDGEAAGRGSLVSSHHSSQDDGVLAEADSASVERRPVERRSVFREQDTDQEVEHQTSEVTRSWDLVSVTVSSVSGDGQRWEEADQPDSAAQGDTIPHGHVQPGDPETTLSTARREDEHGVFKTEHSTSAGESRERGSDGLSASAGLEVEYRPDRRHREKRTARKREGELRYKLEERVEVVRPQLTRARDQEGGYPLDSFYGQDMFSSSAQQRAAWRARTGDFSLSASPGLTVKGSGPRAGSLMADTSSDVSDSFQERSFSMSWAPECDDVLGEVDKLRQEYARMMQLLERSRCHASPLLSQLLPTRSASPPLTRCGSGSSSSESVVTVITGRRSVRESAVTSTVSESLPPPGSALESNKDVDRDSVAGREGAHPMRGHHPASIAAESRSAAVSETVGHRTQSLDRDILLRGNTGRGAAKGRQAVRTDVGTVQEQTAFSSRASHGVSSYTEERVVDITGADTADSVTEIPVLWHSALPHSDEQRTAWSTSTEQHHTALNVTADDQVMARETSSPRQTLTGHSQAVAASERGPPWTDSPLCRQQGLETGRPPLGTRHTSRTTDTFPTYSTARRQHVEARTVESPRSEMQRQQDLNRSTAVTVSENSTERGTTVIAEDPCGPDEWLPDVLVQTPRAVEGKGVPPVGAPLLPPSLISTGVEATVDSSDDFTQTDAEDEGIWALSQLNTSRTSIASSGTSETRRIRAELDRLHQERVEIIELLSLQYLPGSLTVELLEAKLNYCLGQTDMLLDSLEKAWTYEEPVDASRHQRFRRHEEILWEYRQQFEQSRQDLRVCMEEAQRMHSGARGRRRTRTRDVIAVRRRAQIEAFKEERRREQALYDGCRNASPDQSDAGSITSQDLSDPGRRFAPQFMTPKQHKEHLLRLRRSVVAASSEELNERRERSRSGSVSRSSTPDYSVSPASSRSNLFPSRESSSSLSPDRNTMSRPSPFTVSSFAASSQATSRSYSAPAPRAPERKVPSLVLPSADQSSVSPSQSLTYLAEPRSNSCGPSVSSGRSFDPRHLAPPGDHLTFDRMVPSSSVSEGEALDPEQLLRESYAARQLNREQISKAQEALRLLEQHRHRFRSHMRSTQEGRQASPLSRQVESSWRAASTGFGQQGDHSCSSRNASSAVPLLQDSSEPPDSTSTPRSRDSFAAYARDVLTRSERHLERVLAHSSYLAGDSRGQDVSFYPHDGSASSAASSLLSPGVSRDGTSPSARGSVPFTASRPISARDIKARIARQRLEKMKTKE